MSDDWEDVERRAQIAFLKDFAELLNKHNAVFSADDHFEGYPECGMDVRIEIEIGGSCTNTVDLGAFFDAKKVNALLAELEKGEG